MIYCYTPLLCYKDHEVGKNVYVESKMAVDGAIVGWGGMRGSGKVWEF